MKQFTGSVMKKTHVSLFIVLLLLVSLKAQAATTVTVDDNNVVVTPVVVTREAFVGDFEGRIVGVDYARSQILVLDPNAVERQVIVKPEMINSYRVGDYVQIHPTTDVTVVTLEENPKDFEGEIIRVDIPRNEIMVQDTNGRERRVQMKQGMIGTYKVNDYVRIHLMADLKEAKTIETISDVRTLEGNIVSLDALRSQIVVRDTHGNNTTLWVRQGLINNYHMGEHVRIYTLVNHEEAQLIRVIG